MLSSVWSKENYYTFIIWKNFWDLQNSHFKIEKKMQFLQSEWGPHSFHKRRISCKNRNWQFSLRKHSESWEGTWGCLNFHCATTSVAQWEGKNNNNKKPPATWWEKKTSYDYIPREGKMKQVPSLWTRGADGKGIYVPRRIPRQTLQSPVI